MFEVNWRVDVVVEKPAIRGTTVGRASGDTKHSFSYGRCGAVYITRD